MANNVDSHKQTRDLNQLRPDNMLTRPWVFWLEVTCDDLLYVLSNPDKINYVLSTGGFLWGITDRAI